MEQKKLSSAVEEHTELTKEQDLEIRNRVFYYCDQFLRQYAEKIDKIIDFIEKQEDDDSLKSIEYVDLEDDKNDMQS